MNSSDNSPKDSTDKAAGPSGSKLTEASIAAPSGSDVLPEESRPDFVSIPPDAILNSRVAPFDLYVEVGEHPVRVFKQGEPLDRKRFDRYVEKGDGTMLAKSDSIRGFLESSLYEFLALACDETQKPASRARGFVRTLEFLALDLFLFHFTKENLPEKLDRISHAFRSGMGLLLDPDIRPHLLHFRKTEKMPVTVSQMVDSTIVSMSILAHLQSVPLPTLHAFLVATFLRDLSLLPNSILSRPAFDRHPEESLKLLKGHALFTEPLELIIMQHHESQAGTGYPKGLKSFDIYKLARIPLAAERLIELLRHPPQHPGEEDHILEQIAYERFGREPGTSPVNTLRETLRECRGALP